MGNIVTYETFGARGDGIHDDGPAMSAAHAVAGTNGRIIGNPMATYRAVNGFVPLLSGMRIDLRGAKILRLDGDPDVPTYDTQGSDVVLERGVGLGDFDIDTVGYTPPTNRFMVRNGQLAIPGSAFGALTLIDCDAQAMRAGILYYAQQDPGPLSEDHRTVSVKGGRTERCGVAVYSQTGGEFLDIADHDVWHSGEGFHLEGGTSITGCDLYVCYKNLVLLTGGTVTKITGLYTFGGSLYNVFLGPKVYNGVLISSTIGAHFNGCKIEFGKLRIEGSKGVHFNGGSVDCSYEFALDGNGTFPTADFRNVWMPTQASAPFPPNIIADTLAQVFWWDTDLLLFPSIPREMRYRGVFCRIEQSVDLAVSTADVNAGNPLLLDTIAANANAVQALSSDVPSRTFGVAAWRPDLFGFVSNSWDGGHTQARVYLALTKSNAGDSWSDFRLILRNSVSGDTYVPVYIDPTNANQAIASFSGEIVTPNASVTEIVPYAPAWTGSAGTAITVRKTSTDKTHVSMEGNLPSPLLRRLRQGIDVLYEPRVDRVVEGHRPRKPSRSVRRRHLAHVGIEVLDARRTRQLAPDLREKVRRSSHALVHQSPELRRGTLLFRVSPVAGEAAVEKATKRLNVRSPQVLAYDEPVLHDSMKRDSSPSVDVLGERGVALLDVDDIDGKAECLHRHERGVLHGAVAASRRRRERNERRRFGREDVVKGGVGEAGDHGDREYREAALLGVTAIISC